jgi:hypothetical protein
MRGAFVLAILAALAAGGALSVVLSPLAGAGRIRVDGDDGDWAGVRSYLDDPGDAPADLDIVSFSFLQDRTRLSFLVKVAGRALAGGPAEPDRGDSCHFLIDADGKRETGYAIAGIGADLELRVTGRSGKVVSASLLRFGAGDQENYSSFSVSGAAGAAASGASLEAQMTVDPGSLSADAAFTVAASGFDDSQDSLGYPVSGSRPTLVVSQEAPAGLIHQKQKGAPLATLKIVSTTEVVVPSLSLKLSGPVANPSSDAGTAALENGRIVIRDLPVPGSATVKVSADLDTAADQTVAGAFVESSADVSGNVLALVHPPGRDALKYVVSAPGQPAVDRAFGDWPSARSDPAGDAGGVRRADLAAFDLSRSGSSISVFARVDRDLFAGAAVPFHAPLVVFQPPKPGNGSGQPPAFPRATGEDIMIAYIDADNVSGTGFAVGGIGAEGALVATGREGRLATPALYGFRGMQGSAPLWARVGAAQIAADGAQWEGSADISPLNPGAALKVVLEASTWDRNGEDLSIPVPGDLRILLGNADGMGEDADPEAPAFRLPGALPTAGALEPEGDPPLPEPNLYQGALAINQNLYNGATQFYGSGGTATWRAQSFTVPWDMWITATGAVLCDNGTASNSITMELRLNTVGGTLVGSASGTPFFATDCSLAPFGYGWVDANWTGSGPKYFRTGTVLWIIMKCSTCTSPDETYYWLTNSANPYSGGMGSFTTNGGGSWTDLPGSDRTFRVQGSELFPFEDNMEDATRAGLYTVVGGVWARGSPSAGNEPSADHTRSGTNQLWGTVIGGNYLNSANAQLYTNYILLPSASEPVLSFWTWYDTQSLVDGGRVQISPDSTNPSGWFDIAPSVGYPTTCSALPANAPCFGGASGGWSRYVFDLTTWIGNTVRFRFDFRSDASVNGAGWYIDDLRVGEPIEILEVRSSGTGFNGEGVRFHNFGPFAVDMSSWTFRADVAGGPVDRTMSGSLGPGANVDFNTPPFSEWLGDSGGWILVQMDITLTGYSGTTQYILSPGIRVDYMQYGTTTGSDRPLFGPLWTGAAGTPPAPGSGSYLARADEGSFTGVDTGDSGDWTTIPEAGASAGSAIGGVAVVVSLTFLGRNLPRPRRRPGAAPGKH